MSRGEGRSRGRVVAGGRLGGRTIGKRVITGREGVPYTGIFSSRYIFKSLYFCKIASL